MYAWCTDGVHSHLLAIPKPSQSHPKAIPKLPQGSHKAPTKPGTCVVQARYKPCAWEGIGRCKPSTCVVQATSKPPRKQGKAGKLGGRTLCFPRASVGISVAARRLRRDRARYRQLWFSSFPTESEADIPPASPENQGRGRARQCRTAQPTSRTISWPPNGLGTRTVHAGSSHHSPSTMNR